MRPVEEHREDGERREGGGREGSERHNLRKSIYKDVVIRVLQ